jgi:type II restriction/modification system DNA methylase subunit YeeA
VDELIKSALKPVTEKKMDESDDKEAAILSLKVCDPACGSGAFLIAATNYLGKELAKVRTDQSEPPDADIQRARRDVLQHCIYGVDLNLMAVELTKVSLWIDTAVKDMPLIFLDHHIKCGNSLIGATPELIEKGIPDEAFNPVEGDDKEFAKEIKNRNKNEKKHWTFVEFEWE